MNWAFQSPIRLEGVVRQHFESVGFNALLTLWRRRRMILLLVALAGLAAFAMLSMSEKRYTANAIIQIDFNREEVAGGTRQAASFTLDPSAMVETEARFVRSRAIARQVADRLKNAPVHGQPEAGQSSPPVQVVLESDIQQLMRELSVRNDSRSYLVDIAYTAGTPQQAADIANLFAETYLKNRSETSFGTARRASDWYAAQIRETNASLDQAEAAASDYRRTFDIVETAAEGNALQQQQMREVSTQASAAALARLNEEARLARAQRAVAEGNIPPDIAALPQIQRLIESRETARRQVAELSSSAGALHPGVERARLLLEETETRLRDEVAGAVATIAEDAGNARKLEAELEAGARKAKLALIDTKSREAELRTLQGRSEALRARLKTLNENYVQAQAFAELKPVAANLMIPAEPIQTPSGPRSALILGFAMVAAAIAGGVLAFLLDRRDTGFRKEEEVLPETDCPCLGLLPAQLLGDARHDIALQRETIRAIASSLGLTATQATSKVLLVTSALPGEGKSRLAESLARCLVDMGRRVLVVDASPRSEQDGTTRPALEDMVADTADRRQLLEGRHDSTLPVVQRRTGLAEAGAVFSSTAIEDLVKDARAKFDVIIVEAPPVMLVADALILAQIADIVIQAVRWHRTPKEVVAAALKRLRDSSVRVHGIVLTGVDLDRYRTYHAFFGKPVSRAYRKYYATYD